MRYLISCCLVLMAVSTTLGMAPLLQQGNARVVLVGDSITGLSRNFATGFAHQMDWALKETYSGCTPQIVALGGSGQGVRSWLNTEKRSRTGQTFLDVKGIDVQAELAKPADVLVIMLGMNDVLAPYVADDEKSVESWAEGYRELIANLQSRLHPKVTALGQATLCTEDVDSPKNCMIDKLNARAAKLAAELKLLVLPTNAKMREVLDQGRRRKPDFHVTYDFVHPNEPGHIAVAMGMLAGLGESAATLILEEKHLPAALEKACGPEPSLSYDVKPMSDGIAGRRETFMIRAWLPLPPGPASTGFFRLSAPGWQIDRITKNTREGAFFVTGVPDRLETLFKLEVECNGGTLVQEIRIPAPWLVAAGIPRPYWNGATTAFDAAKLHSPVDEAIAQGGDFISLPGVKWQRYHSSVNFTGGQAPGSVDFAAVTHAPNFEGGYAARWIYSERERPVKLALSVQAFAGNTHLGVRLNGALLYDDKLTSEPRKQKTVEGRLKKGWNTLVCTSSHMQWQWQHSVDLQGMEGDALEDLRYSAAPP